MFYFFFVRGGNKISRMVQGDFFIWLTMGISEFYNLGVIQSLCALDHGITIRNRSQMTFSGKYFRGPLDTLAKKIAANSTPPTLEEDKYNESRACRMNGEWSWMGIKFHPFIRMWMKNILALSIYPWKWPPLTVHQPHWIRAPEGVKALVYCNVYTKIPGFKRSEKPPRYKGCSSPLTSFWKQRFNSLM